MFADYFTLKLGGVTVKGRRLTIKELRSNWEAATSGSLSIEDSVRMIRGHVTLADGGSFDPEDLSPAQLRTLIAELVLPKDGRSVSDFIGLLSPGG